MRSHVVSRATARSWRASSASGSGSSRSAAPARQEELERLARNRNVLAALLEAALGALFLEHGFAAIEDAVVDAFADRIEYALTTHVDHKTDLQEVLARTGRHVTYTEISVEGPAARTPFTCAAIIDGEELGRGKGRTKKAAEQEAARRRSPSSISRRS